MTEKKGLLEKIFGKQDSGCGGGCCCGPKIVPKTDAQQKPDEKKESQEEYIILRGRRMLCRRSRPCLQPPPLNSRVRKPNRE
jgi:hypothetical protein